MQGNTDLCLSALDKECVLISSVRRYPKALGAELFVAHDEPVPNCKTTQCLMFVKLDYELPSPINFKKFN